MGIKAKGGVGALARFAAPELAQVGLGAVVALTAAACGSSSPAATTAASGSNKVPAGLSISSFTTDVASVMSGFKPLTEFATKGSNTLRIERVILPDTTSSTRWVDFDAPYLTDAFADSWLHPVTQFRIDNAQGNDATQLNDATADINLGAKGPHRDPARRPDRRGDRQGSADQGRDADRLRPRHLPGQEHLLRQL